MPEQDGEQPVKLTPAQRLAILEGSVSTNRTVLVGVGMLLLVGLSVAMTIGILKLIQPQNLYVKAHLFQQLDQRVSQLELNHTEWQHQVVSINKILDSSSATALKQQLLEQEASYQLHLNALKQGMRDLARMVPGSRTWLDIYNEQMDEALEQSRAREARLKALQTQVISNTKPDTLTELVVE